MCRKSIVRMGTTPTGQWLQPSTAVPKRMFFARLEEKMVKVCKREQKPPIILLKKYKEM